ncbi:UNVERIFIED_CONTAM: hypothetical protein FKN15_015758 [Acipenser sinensis]
MSLKSHAVNQQRVARSASQGTRLLPCVRNMWALEGAETLQGCEPARYRRALEQHDRRLPLSSLVEGPDPPTHLPPPPPPPSTGQVFSFSICGNTTNIITYLRISPPRAEIEPLSLGRGHGIAPQESSVSH